MRTLLFLDDWLLESYTDIERRWASAQPVAMDPAQSQRLARSAVVLDPRQAPGRFLAWSKPLESKEASLYASSDGLNWSATGDALQVHPYQSFPFETGFFFDPWDADASRRFKLVGFPYARGIEGGPGLVACSPDAVRWRWLRRARWFTRPNGSDTSNHLFFNPLTRRWCVICRRYNTDRRAAMVESADPLGPWTPPRVIVHPDASDPPLMQIYGMAACLYEDDYFVGAIQCYQVPMFDRFGWNPRIKMQGSVEGQLVYSYDGQHWLRSDRSPLVPRGQPGDPGGACVYPHAVIVHPDPRKGIFIYSLGTPIDHGGRAEGSVNDPVPERMLVHSLRRDGFAYLRPRGGTGQITTRTLVPRDAALTLNILAPQGQVGVQVCDPAQKPIPGYSFADAVPLAGDEVAAPVRWRRRKDLTALVGKPIRLQVRLHDARLYAVHVRCRLWYTNTPEPIDGLE